MTTSETGNLDAAVTELPRLEPLRYARTDVLEVAYFEAGPGDGKVTLLLHGFPYDIHSYAGVIPLLAAAGHRVIAPYLRGHGPTRFLDRATPRSGQQAAIGTDVIALMDALGIPRAILAGYDWGGRAACVAAALWPQRCAGIVSVGSYLIQDIATAMTPIRPESLRPSRPSQSRRSPWRAWQTATSRQPTAAPLHATSPGPACTRYPTPDTTFPKNPPAHSPARSWN